jgi:hypothetical protein
MTAGSIWQFTVWTWQRHVSFDSSKSWYRMFEEGTADMAQLALQQADIEYQEFGPQDSPHAPVLFVHGVLVDGRLWREVAEGLARRGFRCIVPTWPLGSHTVPVKETAALSLPGVAEMINDAIVALDLSDVTLVGSDTGGGNANWSLTPIRTGSAAWFSPTATPSTSARPSPSMSCSGCFVAPSPSKRYSDNCGCGCCVTHHSASAC